MFFVESLRLVVPLLIYCTSTVAALSVDEGRNPVCAKIAVSISSSSDVYYPGIYPFQPPASFHNIQYHRFNRRSTVRQRGQPLGQLKYATCEMRRRTRDRS